MADLLASDPNGTAAGHEHAVTGEQHLVLVLQPSGEESEQPSLRHHLRHPATDAIDRQGEKPTCLIVRERDRVVAIGGNCALMDTLQARLPFFEQARNLVGLETEGLPLQARRKEQRSRHAQSQRKQQRHREARQLVDQLLAHGRLEEADRDHADHLAAIEDRRFASSRHAQRPALDPHPRVAGEHRSRVLVDGLADHGRVRV